MTTCRPLLSASSLVLLSVLVLLPASPRASAAVYKERLTPHWAGDGSHFWYRNDLAEGRREFVLVTPESGRKEAAFDHIRMAAAFRRAGMKNTEASRLPIENLQFDLEKQSMRLRVKGRTYRCDLATYRLAEDDEELAKLPGKKERERRRDRRGAPAPSRELSPDGKWRAYLHEHNVWIRSAENGEELQLSTDGTADFAYEQPYWGPDSGHLVAFRVRPGEDGKVHLVEADPEDGGRAKLHTRTYPLPGDRLRTHELNWFDITERRQEKPSGGLLDFNRPRLRWSDDGRLLRVFKIDRGHQRVRVMEFDLLEGTSRAIIDESSKTFIWTYHTQDLGVPLVNWLEGSDEIVYLSEQDGWRHLYLVDVATDTMKQITSGPFVVRRVDRIDEEKRQIWFRIGGYYQDQDPYLLHHFRVNFDGSGLTALTASDGDHEVQFSPDRKFLVATYSRVDQPPVHELRRVSDGSLVLELERADVSELRRDGWQAPEVFAAPGRDGKTLIWGLISRPRNFDPSRKYAVLEHLYAGPHDSFVPKRFRSRHGFTAYTDMDFVVTKIDGMGTANRSKAFHDVCWKNLKDAGFPDRILWHQAVAKKYPWYDISRIGVFGGSAGGQSSTGALLFHPEFYQVAVSSCGCHDNRMDKASWNEQWMGYPVGPHYAASSNIDHADRLRGRLMLIVGAMDTNVPPESTMRLASALIKAGKDFELVVIPGGGHGDGGSYGDRKRRDFFRQHLQGITPPHRNAAP